ncbi:hypothetical protein EDC30_102188 [Paucimonas lemoignei]|uniref:Uncharacterized protein n=1 Tax=Paucimonas lemoignei TaxID=29443 RepID=A0A4R3I3F3_PAULE|nr:hypothetical protein [Paucimonas lemoignei]TCS38449.1 hypothetical protein EDC30_102188 [Paucimonas lemoignei]
MDLDRKMLAPVKETRRALVNKPALFGLVAGLAMYACWSAMRTAPRRARRYSDHAQERRAPLSLFTAGDHPRRRAIDHSNAHPLFERREEVYEAY